MRLIVLHGNGLITISKRLTAIKKDFDPISIIEINGKEKSVKEILMSLSTPPLFSDKRLVVVRDFEEEIDLDKIEKDQNLSLVFVLTKSLPLTNKLLQQAKKLKAEILKFNEEKDRSIFPFLDMLAEKNPRVLLELDRLFRQFGSQYILTMIFYMLRRYLLTSKEIPTFVAKKIEKQRQNFPLEKINLFYRQCLELDFKVKAGLIDEQIGLTTLIFKFLT